MPVNVPKTVRLLNALSVGNKYCKWSEPDNVLQDHILSIAVLKLVWSMSLILYHKLYLIEMEEVTLHQLHELHHYLQLNQLLLP